jgi:hypothetical protein
LLHNINRRDRVFLCGEFVIVESRSRDAMRVFCTDGQLLEDNDDG